MLDTSFIRWSCHLTAAWKARVNLGYFWLVISKNCTKSTARMRSRPLSPILTCLFYIGGKIFILVVKWIEKQKKQKILKSLTIRKAIPYSIITQKLSIINSNHLLPNFNIHCINYINDLMTIYTNFLI